MAGVVSMATMITLAPMAGMRRLTSVGAMSPISAWPMSPRVSGVGRLFQQHAGFNAVTSSLTCLRLMAQCLLGLSLWMVGMRVSGVVIVLRGRWLARFFLDDFGGRWFVSLPVMVMLMGCV
jgi:hypothetical protein